jgi:hypothetical protein
VSQNDPVKPGRATGKKGPKSYSSDLELFKLLWLEYLRVLLRYTEEAKTLQEGETFEDSAKPLVQCVSDNTERVMEFLLAQHILIDETSHCETQIQLEKLADFEIRKELYETTKKVLDKFWEDSPSS